MKTVQIHDNHALNANGENLNKIMAKTMSLKQRKVNKHDNH